MRWAYPYIGCAPGAKCTALLAVIAPAVAGALYLGRVREEFVAIAYPRKDADIESSSDWFVIKDGPFRARSRCQ